MYYDQAAAPVQETMVNSYDNSCGTKHSLVTPVVSDSDTTA